MPPLIPHFLQRKNDSWVPFSKYFDLRSAGPVVEEHELARMRPGPWPPDMCTVYYSTKHYFQRWATQLHTTDNPARRMCRKSAKMFLKRTNKTLCTHITYVDYNGSLCDLGKQLWRKRAAPRLPFACNLKTALQRSLILKPGRLGANYSEWVSTGGTEACASGQRTRCLGRR